MKQTFIALMLLTGAYTAQAQGGTIYKCTGADGATIISNTKMEKNCKAVVSGPDNALPAPKAGRSAATPTPSSFPKVADDAQKARDTDRKRILEQELAAEQKNLEQAKKELAEQEAIRTGDEKNAQKMIDRIQPYKDRVAQHERNIAAINKELSGTK
ncbi:MAG: DUF4124 domain-containing protein [Betaproteobacteria bacterium]